ncbi:MAG: hypothetical protein WC773_01420 [Patescibacteria group bacterium]|jgi:hypothetical protein
MAVNLKGKQVLYVVNGVDIQYAWILNYVTSELGAATLLSFQDAVSMINHSPDPERVGVVFYLTGPSDFPGMNTVRYLAQLGYRVIVIGQSSEVIYGVWAGLAGAVAFIPTGHLDCACVKEAIRVAFMTEIATPVPA